MRKEILSAGLFIIGLVLLVVTSILVYREWGPTDQEATVGNTFYLSPNGNDSGNGSPSSPWKTFTKANNTLKAGDTIILKDGVYPGYQKITVSGTTWKAENQHKAILDGGFSPADLLGTWDKFPEKYDSKCSVRFGDFPAWTNLLSVSGSSNVTVDGLFLRNSCGRGLLVQSTNSATSSNVTIKNNRIDFTFFAGMLGGVDNLQIINNIFTRTSFNDQYSRIDGQNGRNYSVNAMNFAIGKNGVFKGNIVAWSHGEISVGVGAQGAVVEDNILLGVKNFMYHNNERNTTVRNNIFYGLEEKHYPNSFMGSTGSRDGVDWRTVLRNEVGDKVPIGNTNKNIAFYNNIFFNVSLFMSGYHLTDRASNAENVYFAHNTFIAATGTRRLFDLTFNPNDGQNPFLSATFENNMFYKGKNPDALIQASYDGGDKIIFRNNLWPTDVTNTVKGPGDIYTNNPGMVNPNLLATIKAPGISDATVDLAPINALRDNSFLNNLKLKASSPAINAGNSNSTVVGDIPTSISKVAKERDFSNRLRQGNPDIGALEYGASDEVLPTLANTPAISPSGIISPTTQPSNQATLVPTITPSDIVTGNVCGKADVDGDGRFNIADFAEFAKSYGMGTNTCADKDVDYGPCGGRDVNKDGILNIVDFGGSGIGFAQRYYPKTSCAL